MMVTTLPFELQDVEAWKLEFVSFESEFAPGGPGARKNHSCCPCKQPPRRGLGMSLATVNARELLKAAEAEEAAARIELHKLSSRQTHTHLYQFNASIVTPSPQVAKAIVAAAASIASLDTVSADARALTASLTHLSATAESAVRKIRELDGVRTRIQLALDRVEDVIDLQSCLSGVSAATELGDLESAALHIKRFRSLEGHLPVPESDVVFMRHAESVLLEAVTKQFDDAIAENQAYQNTRTQLSTDHAAHADEDTARKLTQIEASISHCCQLMNVLGNSEMGLSRYAAYLRQNYDAECKGQLLELCSMGIDTPAAAINTVSSLFAGAAELLQQISTPATAALFGADNGPRQLLAAVHAVCDRHSARVLRSLARSGRFQAALIARERLLRGEEPRSPVTKVPVDEITAAEAHRVAQLLENPSNDAPFVLSTPGSITSSVYRGVDYFDSSAYEMFLDELALTLQRCSSYLRLLILRASEVDSYRAVDIAESPQQRAEFTLKESHRIRDSMSELGGCYSVLEQSKIQAAVVKAINLDEVVDDGAAGASVDILSARALELVEAPSSALAKWAEVMQSDVSSVPELQVGPAGTGEGALITTMVEDGFYVCSRAMKRAFATGNPECVAGIMNNVVMVIGDRLSAELTIRLRVALEDPSAGVPVADIPSFGVNVSQAQRDRIQQMRSKMMNSPPIKSAAARLVELQSASPSSPLLRSPNPSSPAVKPRAALGTEASVPSARLTEEVASTCIALNNVQLAVACAARMRSQLESQVHDVFTEAREVDKIKASVSGLVDIQQQLKKSLESGINTLCTKLTPRLRTALNVFEGASSLIQYDLSDDQFSSVMEGNNAFSTEFLPVLSSIIAPYQYSLTPPLAFVVISKIAGYVSKQLEPRIRRKRFNQLGGLQFDADVRSLVAFFVDRSSRKVRGRFTRLLQIAQVLNVDHPGEIIEYWGSKGASWELTADEVRSILSLRADFASGEIARLRL